jgi:hypothetical protein
MRCVPAHHFTIAKARAWRSAIEERPPYQRESAVWSLDKQQLFIDSLLNGYDVPKIYLHDLRGQQPTKVYTIVDGKQRLTTIWSFLDDELPLASDFRVEADELPELPLSAARPVGGQRFSELDQPWRDLFLRTYLSVVLIQHATEEDIEALFARLNNGEPLNAAEKRNAMGGDAVRLVRAIAGRPFFAERLHFSNARHHHYELAARLLVTSATDPTGRTAPDLRASAIDAFVRSHRSITAPERDRLTAILDGGLDRMTRVFGPRDPLLSSPSYALLYFLFLGSGAADDVAGPLLREFFAAFQHDRLAALEQPEDGRDETLVEFSGLMQHGAQDPRAIARRLEILRSAWLAYRAAPTASGSPTATVSAASPT